MRNTNNKRYDAFCAADVVGRLSNLTIRSMKIGIIVLIITFNIVGINVSKRLLNVSQNLHAPYKLEASYTHDEPQNALNMVETYIFVISDNI